MFVATHTVEEAAAVADRVVVLHQGRVLADELPAATTFARSGYLRRALEAGVAGYVLKDAPIEQLVDAVRHVAAGTVRNYLSSAITKLAARNRTEAANRAREQGWL